MILTDFGLFVGLEIFHQLAALLEKHSWHLSITNKKIKKRIISQSKVITISYFLFQLFIFSLHFIFPTLLKSWYPFDILKRSLKNFVVNILQITYVATSLIIATNTVYAYIYLNGQLEYQVMILNGKIKEFNEKCAKFPETSTDNKNIQIYVSSQLLFFIRRHILLKE